jgi:murein L,D-transpeptidase YcbB/YkuD
VLESLILSTVVVALAEMGDKTQLLSFVLAAQFKRKTAIAFGILFATLANHFLAGYVGAWIATLVSPQTLRWLIALSFFAFGAWALKPDRLEAERALPGASVFLTTLVAFFLVEMGDKTQLATIALAARYESLVAVVLGTTLGMMIANVPAVWMGATLAHRVDMKAMRWLAAGLFVVLGVLALVAPANAEAPGAPDRDLPQGLDTLHALYEKRGFEPIWFRSGKATPQALRLMRTLRDAGAHGLDPADYEADWIEAELQALRAMRQPQEVRWTALDFRLSGAALRFVAHLRHGRVDPRASGFGLPVPRAGIDPVEIVDRLADAEDAGAVLAAVEPSFRQYRLLKAALARYRRLALDESLTALPAFAGGSVRPGERYAGAGALRRLLAALGDLGPYAQAPSNDEALDDALTAALRSFQERHGLDADGALGRRTFAALTVPLSRRVRQIELTLERLRWLPPFETPPIVVNLPEFRLFALRSLGHGASDALSMDVIVGQNLPETQTPVFLADMKYVVFRPHWDVPESIVQREMLPEILRDPAFLEKNHLELVRGQRDDSAVLPPTPENLRSLQSGALRLRQRPGEDNALGAIKFALPNHHSVYLHATPARRLFREQSRAFSHGCIRVSDPVALAVHVLRDAEGDWSAEKIRLAMNGEPNQRVNLARPVPVLILYVTARATESGQVRFFEDIYGHDAKLDALLRARGRQVPAALRRPGSHASGVEMQEVFARIEADPAATQR